MHDIGLFWQLTLKTIDDLKIVGNENLTLEMYVMQLLHLKNIENQKESLDKKEIKNFDNNLIGESLPEEEIKKDYSKQVKNQLKNIDQVKSNPTKHFSSEANLKKIEIKSFQDLIDNAQKDKEIELKYDLERNVKLVSFNKGKINISFNEKLNKNFIKTLTEKLLQWTGERWIISLSKNDNIKSLYEKNIEEQSDKLNEFKKTSQAKEFLKSFPDAKLINILEENDG